MDLTKPCDGACSSIPQVANVKGLGVDISTNLLGKWQFRLIEVWKVGNMRKRTPRCSKKSNASICCTEEVPGHRDVCPAPCQLPYITDDSIFQRIFNAVCSLIFVIWGPYLPSGQCRYSSQIAFFFNTRVPTQTTSKSSSHPPCDSILIIIRSSSRNDVTSTWKSM